LQYFLEFCSILQYLAIFCNILQYLAIFCSILQDFSACSSKFSDYLPLTFCINVNRKSSCEYATHFLLIIMMVLISVELLRCSVMHLMIFSDFPKNLSFNNLHSFRNSCQSVYQSSKKNICTFIQMQL
jgi:hypothetical protein